MTTTNNNLAGTFNAASIPTLTPEGRKDMKYASLVLLFDKDAAADDVAKTVVEAFEKTGICRYDLVSHDALARGDLGYQKTTVSTPYWSMDAWADAEGGVKNPEDAYKEEFAADVKKAWKALQEPLTANATFTGSFPMTVGMTADEIRAAAKASIDAAIEKAAVAGNEALAREQSKRAFTGEDYQSLAHKGIVAALGGAAVQAFAYVAADQWDATQAQLLKTATTLKLPAGTDFNAMALISLPGDDTETLKARTEATRGAVLKARGFKAG